MNSTVTSTRGAMRCALSLVALSGCVDVAHPFTRAIGPAVARAHRVAAEAERARIAALPRIPEAQRNAAEVVSVEPGVQHALLGPLRADVRGAAVTPAEDVPPDVFQYALHGARGWLFVTEGGTLYTSPTFTGRLRVLRAFGCDHPPTPTPTPPAIDNTLAGLDVLGGLVPPGAWPGSGGAASSVPTSFPSVGRLTLVSPDHREILWSDGASLHALDVPGAVALAWTSETRGAMIVGYQTLSTTVDGGRTWRAIDLGGALPLNVEGRPDGLFVETSAGIRRIDDRDALTPAEHLHPIARLPTPAPTLARLYDRGYARAASPHSACRPPQIRLIDHAMPGLVATLPGHTGRYGMRETVLPSGVAAPFGTPRGRAFADTSLLPAIVSITRPDAPSPGHPVTLAWRGEDERGPFSQRITATAPREIPVTARWRIVAATRAALLVSTTLDDTPDDVEPTQFFWFTATGARPLRLALTEHYEVLATALDDGGATLLTRATHHSYQPGRSPSRATVPDVVCAIVLSPNGDLRGQRCLAVPVGGPKVLGLGERDAQWGLVIESRGDSESLTFLALDGSEHPFGEWRFLAVPPVCGARSADAMRLHLLQPDPEGDGEAALAVSIGPQFDGPGFAEARLATFEVHGAGSAPCVRRVWSTQHLEDIELRDGESVSGLSGAFRLTARNGRLVGPLDDGRTITIIPVTLDDAAPPSDI